MKLIEVKSLILDNKLVDAFDALFKILISKPDLEEKLDDLIVLKSTNSNILIDVVGNLGTKEHRNLVKELLRIINSISKSEPTEKKVNSTIIPIKPEGNNALPSIAYLSPREIGSQQFSRFNDVFNIVKKYNLKVDCNYLNIDNLQSLEDYDYLVLETEIVNGLLLIEDDNIEGTYIELKSIEDNLLDTFKGVIIMANGTIDISEASFPVAHLNKNSNQDVKNIFFKLFKRLDKTVFNTSNFKCANVDKWELLAFENGNCQITFPEDNISNFFDKSIIQNFIGRVEDQVRLITKLNSLKGSGRILTVKGAGGMGKTTLVSKVAIELFIRRRFTDGIHMVICEYIDNYELFEAQIASCFYFDDTIDLRSNLSKYNRFDKFIILDNFESITSNLSQEVIESIIKLIEFCSSYCTIVITSRENLGIDIEDKIELGRLSTDDALNLFLKNSKKYDKLSNNDLKILREEIIEEILNNNPLAIKIISSPKVLPKNKSIDELKKDLLDNFFEQTSIDTGAIFVEDSDLNIERKKSVYQSINYSYCKLNNREKLAFELLHLFPDGIKLSTFKKCFNRKKRSKLLSIGDRDLVSLENKSLIEGSKGNVRLQSIVGRFATHKFKERSDDFKNDYYYDAYMYNAFVLEVVDMLDIGTRSNAGIELALTNINNILLAFEYIPNIIGYDKDQKDEYFLNYADAVGTKIVDNGTFNKYLILINSLKGKFKDVENSDLWIDLCEIFEIYFRSDFDAPYKKLQRLAPIDQLINYDVSTGSGKGIVKNALMVYQFEVNPQYYLDIIDQLSLYNLSITPILYYIGDYSIVSNLLDLYTFEIDLNLGRLNIEQLEDRIERIYERNHLSKMSYMYVLSKAKYLDKDIVDKLVVTNPYSKGLKQIMLAFVEENNDVCHNYYEKALTNLEHIKFYYIEAIYHYSLFLKEINEVKLYTQFFEKGLELALEYDYQFHIHQFHILRGDINSGYKFDSSKLSDKEFNYNDFMIRLKSHYSSNPDKFDSIVINSQSSIKSQNTTYHRRNSYARPIRSTLFVEGPTDEMIFSWILNESTDLLRGVDIISERQESINDAKSSGGGVNWLKKRLAGWLANGWKIKAAGIVDGDDDGIECYKYLKKLKTNSQNKSSKDFVEIFKLPNIYEYEGLLILKESSINIPITLEEMYPDFIWEYALSQNMLEERKNLNKIISTCSDFDLMEESVSDYINRKSFNKVVKLMYQVQRKHKEVLANYVINLQGDQKKECIEPFLKSIGKIDSFFKA